MWWRAVNPLKKEEYIFKQIKNFCNFKNINYNALIRSSYRHYSYIYFEDTYGYRRQPICRYHNGWFLMEFRGGNLDQIGLKKDTIINISKIKEQNKKVAKVKKYKENGKKVLGNNWDSMWKI